MSRSSGDPGLVVSLVKPIEARLAAFTVQDGTRPTPLGAASAGSSDPAIAKALLAAPSSNTSRVHQDLVCADRGRNRNRGGPSFTRPPR